MEWWFLIEEMECSRGKKKIKGQSIITECAFIRIINRDNNQFNPPLLPVRHHRFPSSDSSSWRGQVCRRRMAIWARSRCAFANPIARWTTGYSPPVYVLCNKKTISNHSVLPGLHLKPLTANSSIRKIKTLPKLPLSHDKDEEGSRQEVNRR